MANPLISIIIPMYNVERYISRCLESCINQTLNNIEILIINDCGSDSSLKIAQSYAQKDSRIKIINNVTNQGLFFTRIIGEKNANGTYILPLDADDFISNHTCKILSRAIFRTSPLITIIKLFRNIAIGGGGGNMSNSPQISIIIPMYNVERYISRCLESCINQTLNNIEILIVDDCGSDSSLKIAQSYAKKDYRIRIVNNTTNQGTFNARLQGIKEASGIYLLFLDADDFLAKEACEVALKKAISSVDSHEVNSSFSKVNLPLGNHCIDLAFRHKAQTQSPLSLCAKNSTSKTADTRILRESQGNSVKSMESNAESLESSLRGQHPKQFIKSCEAQPPLAPLRGAKKERKGGSSASALLELEAENSEALPLKAKKQSFLARRGSGEEGAALFAKKSDYINENISAESRRSERVESFTKNAESHTESQKDSSDSIDFSDSKTTIDCHANPCGLSRNDDSITSSLRGDNSPKQSTPLYRHCEHSQNVKQSIKNANFVNDAEFFAKSAEYLKDSSDSKTTIDCHANPCGLSRNDEKSMDCHDLTSSSLAMTAKGDSTDSSDSIESNHKIVSHDSAMQNLAMTEKDDSTQSSDFSQNSHEIYQNDFEIPASMLDSLPDIVHFRSHYLADSDSSLLENLKHKVRYILPTHLSRKALKGEAIAYHFFLKSYHFPRFTIWDKCYKKSLLLKAHSVLPPISQLTMAEDMLKFLAIALFAKSYVSVDKRLYFYCLNATSSTQDRGKILARITQMHAIIRILKHLKITQDSNLQSLITQRMIKNLKSLIILELRFTPLQELQSQFLQEDAAIYHWLNALLGGGQELYAQLFENLLYLAYILEAKSHLYPHICLYFKLWAYQALKDSLSIHFRRKHYA